MWKLRIGAFFTSGLVALSLSAAAQAGSGGPNAGDVWVDNVGQPAGPGHEMDPHLSCRDNINLWGSGMTDASGGFTIDGWAPSGSQEQDYSDTWAYSSPGDQVMAVIDVSKLINQAEANGDAPAAQGFHFKLQFTQDPQKHKTFWLDCTPSPSGGGGGSNGGGDGGGNNGGGDDNGGGNSNDGPPGTTSTSTTPATTSQNTAAGGTSSIGGATTTRQTSHRRHKKHHHKHHKLRRHRVRAVRVRLPSFTG